MKILRQIKPDRNVYRVDEQKDFMVKLVDKGADASCDDCYFRRSGIWCEVEEDYGCLELRMQTMFTRGNNTYVTIAADLPCRRGQTTVFERMEPIYVDFMNATEGK